MVGARPVKVDDALGTFVGVTNVELRGLARLLLSGRMDSLRDLARLCLMRGWTYYEVWLDRRSMSSN